jgi:hypothetical protein
MCVFFCPQGCKNVVMTGGLKEKVLVGNMIS